MSDGERAIGSSSSAALELPQLVAALREARSSQADWHQEQPEQRVRPSRDALISIVKGLRAALFPTHFGGAEATASSVDYFVGNMLGTTLRALTEQVRRELRASGDPAADGGDESLAEAQHIVRVFGSRLPEVRRLLELDIRAAYEGDPAAHSRSEVLFCYPGVAAIINHRLAHELYRLGLQLLARVMSEAAHSTTGIDIHPGAQIGQSFFIDHGTGVVIGETTIIGDRVRLYQGVTLGARNIPTDGRGVAIKGRARHPIIEDDVVIYAGATILGRITIGHGATIGGNVWLTHDVPPMGYVTQAQPRDDSFDAGAGI